jgi:flagellar M-ring protein FliF
VEKLNEFFDKFKNQFGGFWSSLDITKKIAFGAVAVLLLIALGALFTMSPKDSKEYLFTNLSDTDRSDIVSYLKKNGVTDYIQDSNGIKVDPEKVLELRVKLASEGLPAGGTVGWEKFDSQDFTRTEFEQHIHKLRAIQGELQRTIMSVKGVSSARVHLVTPEKSLFTEDTKEPTASVYIKTKRGSQLDNTQIRGIVHMVSSAVEGMTPSNVTIIDHEGKLLTAVESKDPTTKLTNERLKHRRTLQKELEQKIKGIVGRVVGPDRVEAKVDVEVDFTKEKQTISDVDPDRTVAISVQTNDQKIQGNGLNPTGIPGAKSNVPGEQENISMATSSASSTRVNERTNFEVAKTLKEKEMAVGDVMRITAAVLVDGKQPYPVDGSQPQFEARTVEEMKKIEELVRSAIGYKEGRDEVKVHNMLFQLDPFQIQNINEEKKETQEYISTLIVSATVAVALVLFFALIVRPYFRWLSYDPNRKKDEAIVEEFRPDLELGGTANVQVKEDIPFEKLTPTEQVHYLAKHEPARTTEAIRMLLSPHSG